MWNKIFSLALVAFSISLSAVFIFLPQWLREYGILESYPYTLFYLAGFICIGSIIVIAISLRKHKNSM